MSIENFLPRQHLRSYAACSRFSDRARLGGEAPGKERLYSFMINYCGEKV